jgi:glycosyltransferase involved in cell wall biosynthesis
MEQEKIFDGGPERGVDVVASISSEQIEAFSSVFGDFPRERIVLSHNGYNQQVFHPAPELYADRERVLAGFTTQPPPGDGRSPEPVAPEGGFDAVVAFVGKFADWKRLDALLRAAASYEHGGRRVLTLVAGSGPVEQQVRMHELAAELGLERTYFLGPRQQEELATIFACADVGVFPSWREPFGLVFLECMACGTPVIGADSGGPRDFVTDEVGTLVAETDDRQELADSLAATVERSLDEGWKQIKGPEAARYAHDRFSVVTQVSGLLSEVDRIAGG